MRYCIDRISVETSPQLILKIVGWAFSEEEELSLDIVEGVVWRLSKYIRADVAKIYGLENQYCGFTLEIQLESSISAITILFQDSIEKQEKRIIVSEYISHRSINRKLKNNQNYPLSSIRSGNVEDKLLYCFDIIRFNEYGQNLFVRGWAFSEDGKAEISTSGGQFEINWYERKDVNEVYGGRYSLPEFVGFEFSLGVNAKQGSDVDIYIKDNIGDEYRLSLPCKVLSEKVLYESIGVPEQSNIGNSIKKYFKKKRFVKKYGKTGAEFKLHEQEIFLKERALNALPYYYQDIVIPEEWIDIQKEKPILSVVVAIHSEGNPSDDVCSVISSFRHQKYSNWQLVLVGKFNMSEAWDDASSRIEILELDSEDKQVMLFSGLKLCRGEYILFMDQEDSIETNYFSCIIERINESRLPMIIYSDYDISLNGKPLVAVNREDNFSKENIDMLLTAVFIRSRCLKEAKDFSDIIKTVKGISGEHCCHENRIQYHYAAVPDKWNAKTHAKMIAFYLTQFHENEENNKWWGEGFTEWTNVKRAVPMYEGHNQPRVPGILGYYDLVEDRSVQYKQIELAKRFGIYGFCYYYYWFEGKRLLRKPLDQFMENKELDIPFCICWANETWSRRWDGEEQDVLMKQVHNEKTDVEFIRDMIPMFRDKRYIKVNGKPLLLIYRIELFPEPYNTIQRWRKCCLEEGIGEIHISIAQTFNIINHKIYGADSSVEFPPHKIGGDIINERILPRDSKFVGTIRSYKDIVQNLSTIVCRDYNMITDCMMEWDNTARKMNASNIYAEFTPELFRQWLIKNLYYTRIYNDNDIMFINAWNEWAEGTYLDPDGKYGTLMLDIVQDVLSYK